MRHAHRLVVDREGSAAAEMALVLPLLLALMFGSFELGNFFMSEHAVQKAVRDASRYAARLPMTDYPSCTPTAATQTLIQRVARTGDPSGTAPLRLAAWTDDAMTTVTMACDTSGTYTGLYTDFPNGVPVITVSASVPYPSLFGAVGLGTTSLTLNAVSQAAVFGA